MSGNGMRARGSIAAGLMASVALGAACDGGGGGDNAPTSDEGGSSIERGSSGGFSAGLSKDMKGSGGSGSAIAIAAARSGSADAGGGSGSADAGSGSADAGGSGPIDAAVASDAGIDAAASVRQSNVAVPAELAAIKLDMAPGWDRDIDTAGTISTSVPNGKGVTKFVFHYGYEADAAPAPNDDYERWLHDQKILDVAQDRQRGAAWLLRGTDGNGAAAWRIIVKYGGKRLMCSGSQYKDAESSRLGKARDNVVVQAQKICETLSL